jgi:hypothetical protein
MTTNYNDAQERLLELWKCIPMPELRETEFVSKCIDAWEGYDNSEISYPAHQLRALEKEYGTTIQKLTRKYQNN